MERRQGPRAGIKVFRANLASRIGSGVMAVAGAGLALTGLRSGQYALSALALVAGVLPLLANLRLLLELTVRQLRYRTLFDARTIALEQVSHAWIEAPRGFWSYWRSLPVLVLGMEGSRPLVLNLRALPDAAVVAVGDQLRRRGIGIGVADTAAARRVAARIWPPARR